MQIQQHNEKPLVTVLVGCFNHSRFVEECLESVRNQTYHNRELIIFDDCSPDNSVEVIQSWIERTKVPCRFIQHARNMGLCKSLNEVIPLARGKYISGLAADDAWLPKKLETQVTLMESLPNRVGVVYSDAYQMDEQGKLLPDLFIGAHRKLDGYPQGQVEEILWQGNFIPAMTTMTRRECFDHVGLYDESLFYEDWDMWLRIAREFDFAFSSEPTAKYRIVGTSMMRSSMERMILAANQICIKHLRGGTLKPSARQAAKASLSTQALISYRLKALQYRRNLLRALLHSPSVGLAAACVCACSGLDHDTYYSIRSRFKRLFGMQIDKNLVGGLRDA
jgi:glycosyltransferase involved in cell wall biosynthesis